MSRHPDRQKLKLTDGVGVDAALECVATNEAMQTALAICRAGAVVGNVGLPHDVEIPDLTTDLNGIAEAYAAMDERRAIKSLVRVGDFG